MSDRYTQFANSPLGRMLIKNLGLPAPLNLDRFQAGEPVINGAVLLGAAPGAVLTAGIARTLKNIQAEVHSYAQDQVVKTAKEAGLGVKVWNPEVDTEQKFKALVFDASGITRSDDLVQVYHFFHPVMRKLVESSRIIILGLPPEACTTPRQATAQRALEGFTRSLGKEVKKGGAAQLVYVAQDADKQAESTLRFFLSPRSAYVSAQVVRISASNTEAALDWNKPLAGKVALVTGASRGIGEAIAKTLARDGAHVVGLDIPALSDDLRVVTSMIGGSALALDITAGDAPAKIADYLKSNHGGVDIIVHNAGVTRDKTLANMTQQQWDMVMNINLCSEERINDELLAQNVIRENGRVICVSSISGIAGNMGQSNYGMSKAGVIGMVQSMAPLLYAKNITINAVAPGFIETAMTAAIPFAIREAGRRMNSMSQGGLPIDVAETIAWYASPASAGVNGNIVRVCGQSLIGA
ncbi:MAG: 3-oxoacyl-ACP reductase [Moraxellaceae bacterium]|nr:3-oxoacyl-ACP reductase [Moraxellaceae bacterium]